MDEINFIWSIFLQMKATFKSETLNKDHNMVENLSIMFEQALQNHKILTWHIPLRIIKKGF